MTNPYQSASPGTPFSDSSTNKTSPRILRFVIGALLVLVASMSLNLMFMRGPGLPSLEILQRVMVAMGPFTPNFVIALALALAWPRFWFAAGCAPMVLWLAIMMFWSIRQIDVSPTAPAIFFAMSIVFTFFALVAAGLGAGLRKFLDSRLSRSVRA
jgi:hypothetical protein